MRIDKVIAAMLGWRKRPEGVSHLIDEIERLRAENAKLKGLVKVLRRARLG